MSEIKHQLVAPEDIRIGMFVELELGWMSHPFPSGSFKVTSAKQLEILRSLGLKQVRINVPKSDVAPGVAAADEKTSEKAVLPPSLLPETLSIAQQEQLLRKERAKSIAEQQRSLAVCDRRFGDAIRLYKKTTELLVNQPAAAHEQSLALVTGYVNEMLGEGESAIRLLSEGMGDRAAMHPINVSVISLLLGKAIGLAAPEMIDLGMAAFLHDIGKTTLPDRVRWLEENFSSAEYKMYQEHVPQGLAVGKRMGLSAGALTAISQHHEMADGSGFPTRMKGDTMTRPAKILALVNRYENLCNPARPASAMTPHEALSVIFAQLKTRFDGAALSAFIRMMGVYPPGSVVQLVDQRYALVVSVNSSRPLKPRVIVHEPGVPKDEALIVDLEHSPSIGIRRSLKVAALPEASLNYLSPRNRICYFFERAVEPPSAAPPGGVTH